MRQFAGRSDALLVSVLFCFSNPYLTCRLGVLFSLDVLLYVSTFLEITVHLHVICSSKFNRDFMFTMTTTPESSSSLFIVFQIAESRKGNSQKNTFTRLKSRN